MIQTELTFWEHLDTTEKFWRLCNCTSTTNQHNSGCTVRTPWEQERDGLCLAQSGDGTRCYNLAGRGLPFCSRYHEAGAWSAIASTLAAESTIHNEYGHLNEKVRVVARLLDVAHLFLSEADKRQLASLLGIKLLRGSAPVVKAAPANAPATPPTRRCSLYRHYDRDGVLLYVGISVDPEAREKSHRASSPWWEFVASSDVDWYLTEVDAAFAERRAITDEGPIFNKAGAQSERNARAIHYLVAHEAYELLRATA